MLRAVSACLITGVLSVLLAGCQTGHRVAYEARLEMTSLHAGLPMPDNSFTQLTGGQTQNRFPCPLAIARLVPGKDAEEGALVTAKMTPAEQSAWAEAFRGFSAIRHLVFLAPRSLLPDGRDDMQALLAAAGRINAPLLLVHVVNRYGPNSAQVFGVLYDVASGSPLATVGASQRILDEDGDEVALDNEHEDLREMDARYQATRSFETYTVACLREQVGLDVPPEHPLEHDWFPIYPRYQMMPPPPAKGAAPAGGSPAGAAPAAPTTQPVGSNPEGLPPPAPNRPMRVATPRRPANP
ncbi:MAG: hypothetical protein PVJ57_13775 [Phycisphaerae bacterium]|jgi:hypothetical protein